MKITFNVLLVVIASFLCSCGEEAPSDECGDFIPICLSEDIQLITSFLVENNTTGIVFIAEYELNDKIYYRVPVYGSSIAMDKVIDTNCELIGFLENNKDVAIDGFMFLEDASFRCRVWEY